MALFAGLGFTAAVNADNAAFQWLADSAVEVDSFDKGLTAYRKLITEGNNGDPAAALPPPVFGLVPTALSGIFERLVNLVERIRVAPNYSEEEGEQLGIVPAKSESIEPDLLQPTLKAKAMPGNIVTVEFVRGKTDGIAIEMKIDNAADIAIPPSTQNLPCAVELRARYLIGNVQSGLFSDTVNAVTTP
ncbi:MAG: hypothetical protein ACT4O9_09020 [Blastocatellia bacterium]